MRKPSITLFVALILAACGGEVHYDEIYYVETQNEIADYEPITELNAYEPNQIMTARIHPDMPEFTFKRVLGDCVESLPWHTPEGAKYINIIIYDENGELLQVIENVMQGGLSDHMTAGHYLFELKLEDLNFNDYLDMRLIVSSSPGAAGGELSYFWLWDSYLNRFIRNNQLNTISAWAELTVDQKAKQIVVSSRYSDTGPWALSYYEWEDDELSLVRRTFTEFVQTEHLKHTVTTDHDYITGEVTVEFDPPESAPNQTIIKIIEVNPYMEFPAHTVRLDMWHLYREERPFMPTIHVYEIELTITGTRRMNDERIYASRQTIRGLTAAWGEGRWMDIDPQNPLNLHFDDFNGNGYLDMSLRRSGPRTGHIADDAHYFWLFNPSCDSGHNKFLRNYSLEGAASIGQVMGAQDGVVRIFSFHGLLSHYLTTYAYVDGEFVFVSSENISPGLD